MLSQFWNYSGALVIVLLFLYGTRQYLASLFGGFVSYCVFYFRYGFDDTAFRFSVVSALKALEYPVLVYIIAYMLGAGLYTATAWKNRKKRVDVL